MSPFAHTIDISESSVRIYKGKGKYTMCFSGHMGSVVEVQLNFFISTTFLTFLLTRILKINLSKYSISFVNIVKSPSSFYLIVKPSL